MTNPDRLRHELAEVRRTGVGYAREEMSLGSHSVAAPVFDGTGVVVAALAVVQRSDRGEVHRLAVAVRTTAISLSRTLQERARPVPTTAEALTRHSRRVDAVGARGRSATR